MSLGWRSRRGRLFTLVFASLALVAGDRVARRHEGLTAEYYAGNITRPVIRTVEPDISTASLYRTLRPHDVRQVTARWTGFLSVPSDGWYSFSVKVDGSFALQIDSRTLVESQNASRSEVLEARRWLTRGRHLLTAQYSHRTGGPLCEIAMAHGDGAYRRLDRSRLSTRPPSAFRASLAPWLNPAAGILAVLWTLAALCFGLRALFLLCRRWLPDSGLAWALDRKLLVILAMASGLFLAGIGWGLPSFSSWAPDELTGVDIFEAVRARFSGGWSGRYPPFHFYLLTLSNAPLLVASYVGLAEASARPTLSAALLLSRLVSVAMALGALVVVYLTARMEHGRRAGLAAAAILAATLPLSYYAKTANLDVPYVFWLLVSLYFYLRVWHSGKAADSCLFAASAALAVSTKDQAYGFFVLPAAAVAARVTYLRVREAREVSGRLPAAPVAGTLGKAFLTGTLVFALAQNVVFNWTGFVSHLREMLNAGHQYSGMFPNTPQGHGTMLVEAVKQVGWSLGWPLFGVCLAGLAVQLRGASRHRALWLLLPAISYYLFFVTVLRYHYDRFFLGVCAMLALFGGPVLAALMPPGGLRAVRRWRWTTWVAVAALSYSLFRCAALDQLMIQDARYDAERWLRAVAPPSARVALVSPVGEYLPRVHEFHTDRIYQSKDLGRVQPDFVVINREDIARFPANSSYGRLYADLAGGTGGYRLAYRHKARPFGNPLAHFGPLSDEEQGWQSNLDKVNPTIEIYRRQAR